MPAATQKAIAYKAILLAPGLSGATRSVGGALIDHFNVKTGRCDPGVERLASFLGIDRTTVMRGTKELVDAGLFAKRTHGGSSYANAYMPRWERLREIVDIWDAQMKSGSATVAKMRPSRSQERDAHGSKHATQTHCKNPSKGTHEVDEPPPPCPPSDVAGHRKDDSVHQSKRPPSDATPGTKGVPAGEAARQSAYKRVRDAFVASYGWPQFQSLDEATLEAAISAEMKRRGTGLAILLADLHLNAG